MGTITTWRECPACCDAHPHVDDWSGFDPRYDDLAAGPELFHEWARDVLDTYEQGVDDYIRAVGGLIDAPGILDATRTEITQMAAEAEEADTLNPILDDEAWAAFLWLMRTSTAPHLDGITNTIQETP